MGNGFPVEELPLLRIFRLSTVMLGITFEEITFVCCSALVVFGSNRRKKHLLS